MKFLSRLLPGRDADGEDERSTRKEERSRRLSVEFKRVSMKFNFVRGGSETLEYDVFDGQEGTDDRQRRVIEAGVREATRGGTEVEKLYKVDDAYPIRVSGKNTLRVCGREVHEIVPVNVNSRSLVSEVEMCVRVPVTESVRVDEETGEVLRRRVPYRDGETEVVRAPKTLESN